MYHSKRSQVCDNKCFYPRLMPGSGQGYSHGWGSGGAWNMIHSCPPRDFCTDLFLPPAYYAQAWSSGCSCVLHHVTGNSEASTCSLVPSVGLQWTMLLLLRFSFFLCRQGHLLALVNSSRMLPGKYESCKWLDSDSFSEPAWSSSTVFSSSRDPDCVRCVH